MEVRKSPIGVGDIGYSSQNKDIIKCYLNNEVHASEAYGGHQVIGILDLQL